MENLSKSAFPLHLKENSNPGHLYANGLTKKEYASILILQSIISGPNYMDYDLEERVELSIKYTNELFKQLGN